MHKIQEIKSQITGHSPPSSSLSTVPVSAGGNWRDSPVLPSASGPGPHSLLKVLHGPAAPGWTLQPVGTWMGGGSGTQHTSRGHGRSTWPGRSPLLRVLHSRDSSPSQRPSWFPFHQKIRFLPSQGAARLSSLFDITVLSSLWSSPGFERIRIFNCLLPRFLLGLFRNRRLTAGPSLPGSSLEPQHRAQSPFLTGVPDLTWMSESIFFWELFLLRSRPGPELIHCLSGPSNQFAFVALLRKMHTAHCQSLERSSQCLIGE